jgi:hypothetical protein
MLICGLAIADQHLTDVARAESGDGLVRARISDSVSAPRRAAGQADTPKRCVASQRM